MANFRALMWGVKLTHRASEFHQRYPMDRVKKQEMMSVFKHAQLGLLRRLSALLFCF